MRHSILIFLIISFLISCQSPTKNIDNESVVGKSILDTFEENNFKILKNFKEGIQIVIKYNYNDIELSSFSKLKFSKKIKFAYSEDEYYVNYSYKTAERGKTFAYITFKLKSKYSPNQLGIKTTDFESKFLPSIAAYSIDDSLNNLVYEFSFDNYNMMKKLPSEVIWLEEYFNYKEEGEMIFYKEVDESLSNSNLVISVLNGGKLERYGNLNTDGIISVYAKKLKLKIK